MIRAAINISSSRAELLTSRRRIYKLLFEQPLFLRSHAGVESTSAGHRFRRYAAGMQQLWQQSRQEISLPEGYRTVLGLGAQISLWEYLVTKWIPRMRTVAPDVALRLEVDYSPSLMRQLSDGLLDIAVMYQPRRQPGLVIEELLEETLVLVSTDPREVSAGWVEDYVSVDWGDTFRARHGEAFPDMDTPAVSVGLGALGLQYILENGGSGYFSRPVVEPLVAEGKLYLLKAAPRGSARLMSSTPTGEVLRQALQELRIIANGQ